ncbi:hypothetical protein NDU88_000557, partial [Pleurodeles waltl]
CRKLALYAPPQSKEQHAQSPRAPPRGKTVAKRDNTNAPLCGSAAEQQAHQRSSAKHPLYTRRQQTRNTHSKTTPGQ